MPASRARPSVWSSAGRAATRTARRARALTVHRRGLGPDRAGRRAAIARVAHPRPRALRDRGRRRNDDPPSGAGTGAIGAGTPTGPPRSPRSASRATTPSAALAPFAPLSDPNELPGPLKSPRVLAELALAPGLLRQLARGLGHLLVQVVRRPRALAAAPRSDRRPALARRRRPRRARASLSRDPPGEDALPRPDDVGRWRARFGELLDEFARASAGSPDRGARRSSAPRRRSAPSSSRRRTPRLSSGPARELLELGFGELDHETRGRARHTGRARSRRVELRGRIDRIDLAADGRSAIVRDYKTGKSVAERRQVRRSRARCRSSSTCSSRAESSDSTRSAGSTTRSAPPTRMTAKPRGLVARGGRATQDAGPRPHRPQARRGARGAA